MIVPKSDYYFIFCFNLLQLNNFELLICHDSAILEILEHRKMAKKNSEVVDTKRVQIIWRRCGDVQTHPVTPNQRNIVDSCGFTLKSIAL